MNARKNVISALKSNKDSIIRGGAVLLGASAGLAIGLDVFGRLADRGVEALADEVQDDVAEKVTENLTEND